MNRAPAGAVVIDASVAIAICAKEAGREQKASTELLRYSSIRHAFFAPGALTAETLYILCGKLHQGMLTPTEHAQAIRDFSTLMLQISPPPGGEASLVARAEAIRSGYGCSRSADGIYIALAEELIKTMPTVILTFDQDMQKQSARHASTVTVQLLTI